MCVGELCNNDISHAAEMSVLQMCLHLSSTDPQGCPLDYPLRDPCLCVAWLFKAVLETKLRQQPLSWAVQCPAQWARVTGEVRTQLNLHW